MSGADDVFGIDPVEVRARIFDDTVIAVLDRPVAGDRNDRLRVNAGSDRRRSHCLEDRVVRRHAEQAARAELGGSTLKSPVFCARSAAVWTMRTGRVRNRPKSSATGYSVR